MLVRACALGQASASLMGAHVVGRTPEELAMMTAAGKPDAQTGNEGAMGKKSADAAPSRQRQNAQDVSDGNKKTA